jgi:DNA-binding beta-propeller fold protein YncE
MVVLSMGVGCGSKFTLRTAQPEIDLQWPYQPSKAKVTYVRALIGLTRHDGARAALRSVVFGGENEDENSFVLPVAVATGGDGRIAVADMGRRCVHLYIPSEERYIRLSGTKDAPIISPVGLVFDDEMRLFLTDSAGRVFGFAPDGAVLFMLDRAGSQRLQRPTGITYSPRRKLLYVVDTLANEVHALRPDGGLEFSFGGRGEGEQRFNFPTHIAWAPSGELFVTDALNFRITIFDEQGVPAGSFGHHGDGSGDLAMPKGLAVDHDGIVYVVDSLFDNVQLFDRKGQFLLTLGKRGTDFGEFWLPSGIHIGADGQLYVCDTYNRRIQVFRITEGYADGSF